MIVLHIKVIYLFHDDFKTIFIIYVNRWCPVLFVQEVNSVYRILAAILNTGNIEFTSTTSKHQTDKSEVPNSEALENGENLFSN